MVLSKKKKELLIKATAVIRQFNQIRRIKKAKRTQNLREIRKRHAEELEKSQESLSEALAAFFEKQAKEAISLFEKSQPFDPRHWDVELINHCYPALAQSMGEVMFAELEQYGVSVDRVKSICRSEKASTASEWLAEAGGSLIEGGLLDSSLGPIDLGFMTEYPEWMKEAIRDNLEETFSQEYWKGINDTTSSDITSFLKKGAEDGWSIERMAKEMSTKFIDDGRYPMGRGRLIARTELGHALNGARSMAMDALIEEVGPDLPMRKQWLSVLGTTTRDTHAGLDGVPADKEGKWTLVGVKCRWPGDVVLPASERCNCQCSIIMAFGMDDESASELISDYSERVAKKKSVNRGLIQKRVEGGLAVKRGTGCGAEAPGAPGFSQNNTCNRYQGPESASGGSVSQKKGPLVAAEDSRRNLGRDAVEKVFCPTGAGGGVDPTCSPGGAKKKIGEPESFTSLIVDDAGNAVPGSVGSFSGTDTSWMKPGSIDSNWALKKIHELEKLALAGNWNLFQKKMSKPTSKTLSKYQKAILEAQSNLWGLHGTQTGSPPPGAIPVQPKQTPPISSGSNWAKVGPQLGTEKGGVYEMGGKKYYVKIPDDPKRAINEVLATQLYDLANGSAIKAHLVEIDGKTAYAAEMLDLAKADWNSPAVRQKAAEDFAIHAWLNNRDAVGAGSENPMDNIKVKEDGSLILVDAGGSLDQVGMGGGGGKKFDAVASEWDTLRMYAINPTMAKVFGGMTSSQLIASGKKLEAVPNGLIEALCKKSGREDLVPILIARKKDILARVSALEKSIEEAEKAPTPIPIPPAPVISAKSYAQLLDPKIKQIQDAIEKGDVSAVEAVKISETSKDPYYQKVAKWKASVISAMKSGSPPAQEKKEDVPGSQIESAPSVPKPSVPPFKVNPEQFPVAVQFYTKNEQQKAYNQAQFNSIVAAATAGDLAALQKMKSTNEVEGQPIYSLIVKAWLNDVTNVVQKQFEDYQESVNPPAPISTTVEKILSSVPSATAKTAILKRAGKWNVLTDLSASSAPPSPIAKPIDEAGRVKAMQAGKVVFDKLPESVQGSLKHYTGGGYSDQNTSLREGNPSKRAIASARAILDHGIEIPEGTLLTRFHDYDGTLQNLVRGSVVADRAILSTSMREVFSHKPVKWEIVTGPGVRGIPAAKFSLHSSEEEVLLPPNTRLVITKMTKGDGGSLIFRAIALPTENNQCCPP